jgi:hypothetical protein
MTHKEAHGENDMLDHDSTAYRRMEALLRTHLYRRNCPPPEQLSLYHLDKQSGLNLLSAEETLIIAQHVRQCPHCQRELEDLAEPEAPPSLRARLHQAVAHIEAQFIPTPGWQAAGLRGQEHPPQRFRTEDLEIHLSQQPGYHHGRWMLLGRLEPRTHPIHEVEGTTVQLVQGEKIGETTVAADGTFTFEEVMAGTYDVTIAWQNQVVILREVQIQ